MVGQFLLLVLTILAPCHFAEAAILKTPRFHEELDSADLKRLFNVDRHEQVGEYHLVEVQERARVRRGADEHVKFTLKGGPFDHDVYMEPAPLPISRDFQAFRVDEKEQRTPIDIDLKNDVSDCLYEGHLQANDRRLPNEKMIASVCDGGLNGILRTKTGVKSIRPIPEDVATKMKSNAVTKRHHLIQDLVEELIEYERNIQRAKEDDDKILSNRNAACSKQHFQPVAGVYLDGHDDKILSDVNLLACKAACVLEESFSCKSIEYSAQDKTCRLSRESTKSAPSQVKEISGDQIKYEMYDHLCRTDCDFPYEDPVGANTKTTLRKTISGKTCQRWDSQTPHTHSYNTPELFPSDGNDVSAAENFCRNPGENAKQPWCYTITSTKWEYCEFSVTVPSCYNALKNIDSTTCSSRGGVFFNNHCYWVSAEKVDSIVEARDKCQKKNARLVSIETASELKFLSAHLQGDESTKWLTSGREIGNSNPRQWAWSLDPSWQQPIKYQQETQWQPGQPDNKLERCIALSKENGVYWSDTNCAPGGKQLNFICEQGEENLDHRPVNIEIALFLDEIKTKEYRAVYKTNEGVLRYLINLLNGVQAIYQDPILKRPVQFTLTRAYLNDKTPASWKYKPDDTCIGMARVKDYNIAHPDRSKYDIAHFFVGSVCGASGLAAGIGFVCYAEKSTTMNSPTPWYNGLVGFSHEFGHILGMHHDVTYKRPECLTGFIMSGGTQGISQCGAEGFQHTMRSLGMNNCLYDNTYQNYKLDQMVTGSMLPGQRVEADEQCKTILGDGWTFLKNFGDRKFTSGNAEAACEAKLPCFNAASGIYKLATPHDLVDGTYCGGTKWCRHTKDGCVDWTKPFKTGDHLPPPKVVGGGWSDWLPWGTCSVTCGTGVMTRLRKCNNPKPKNTVCPGLNFEAKICKKSACSDATPAVSQILAKSANAVCTIAKNYRSGLNGKGRRIGLQQSDGDPKRGCIDGLPGDYKGKASKTVGGLDCAKWTDTSVHSHSYEPGGDDANTNYCRIPDSSSPWPWCYTTDNDKRWDYCHIPDGCNAVDPQKATCKTTPNWEEYDGTKSTTDKGQACAQWTTSTYYYPKDLKAAKNYCRTLGHENRPWCYTVDKKTRWDYCFSSIESIPNCAYGDHQCDVWCESGSKLIRSGRFPDGTPCHNRHDDDTNKSLCVQGLCKQFNGDGLMLNDKL